MPPEHEVFRESTTSALPVAPSMGPALRGAGLERRPGPIDRRVWRTSLIAIGVAVVAALIAQILTRLIAVITNIAFYGQFSFSQTSPAGNHLGPFVIIVPVIGGLLVGVVARYGSKAIRGHGIPEAMEQVLLNQSRIPPRMMFLKPFSAAIAIGTGGPFGAEGPIIATGGALGSVMGQVLSVTADERKTLLAAGAGAGMAATFGTPVAAVLLAVELLLFEYRPRSLIPVSLACVTAAGIRVAVAGTDAVFAMPTIQTPSGAALVFYVGLGALMGVIAVVVTRGVYWMEDGFERLPLHWMWWPALGGLAVGLVGYVAPRTMGVGYNNIEDLLSGRLVGSALLFLVVMKLISWTIALASGTSGGTLAPLFTIGGGLGATLGALAVALAPHFGIDPRIAALVGMAAIFAGASRAVLASVVFAFETTHQPIGLLPLLGGCSAAYMVSFLLMENSIMTEKIARRGVRVPGEYSADFLDQILVADAASTEVVTLEAELELAAVRGWLTSPTKGEINHQGFPVTRSGELVGVVTRRDLFDGVEAGERRIGDLVKRPPVVVTLGVSLRAAADIMAREGVGRLAVVAGAHSPVVGMLTRGDLLFAHRRRLDDNVPASPTLLKARRGRVVA